MRFLLLVLVAPMSALIVVKAPVAPGENSLLFAAPRPARVKRGV